MELVIEKDFKDITIKDITQRATVNRANWKQSSVKMCCREY